MEEMPGKSVTIVTSKEIMPVADGPDFPQKFRPRLLEKLQKIGVTVHTDAGRVNCSLNEVNEGGFIVGKKTYTWNGGEMVADLCIVATGMRQIPPLYADSGLESWLDDKGLVSVSCGWVFFRACGELVLQKLVFRRLAVFSLPALEACTIRAIGFGEGGGGRSGNGGLYPLQHLRRTKISAHMNGERLGVILVFISSNSRHFLPNPTRACLRKTDTSNSL